MPLDSLERYHAISGPIQRLDPRIKLIAAMVYVVAVVITPAGWWITLGFEGLVLAFVIGLAGLPPWQLLRRWLAFFVLVGFVSLLIAPSHASRREIGLAGVVLSLLARNSLAFLMMLVLSATTPFHRLVTAMRRLGAPRVLASTLQFMYRYLFVLGEELDRMLTARRARSFGRRGVPGWGMLTGSIAMLFLRTFERGERVHSAMIARGWDGNTRTLDP
jgi:cobalt/nickel transport system permease protein